MKIDKQAEVLKYLHSVDQATKREIYDAVPFGYYHNWDKHFGALLTRMVRSNLIERIGHGVYKYKSSIRHKSMEQEDPEQIKLFN